jgi:hypothetical protein
MGMQISQPFCVYLCLKSENLPCTPTSFVKTNLFELTSAINGLGQGTIARFDPSLYPVRSPKMSDNIETWDKLCSDLIRASKDHGNCVLTSNTNGGGNRNQRILLCSRGKYYVAPKKIADRPLWKHTMNQNKQHNCSNNGKSQRKKTATSLPLKESNETTCKVRLAIGIDSLSFFVVGGRGHGIHEDHPPLEPTEMPTRKRMVHHFPTNQIECCQQSDESGWY